MHSYHAPAHPSNQHGTVLIVSLVMLTILTILAVGTTSDVGLQTNMAKNSQISLRAFNASIGQLKTTFNDLRKNNTYNDVLGALLLTKTATVNNVSASSSNPFNISTRIFQVASDEDDSQGGANIHGAELSNSMTTTVYTFELNSVSSLPNLDIGLGSDQTFNVIYTVPPGRN